MSQGPWFGESVGIDAAQVITAFVLTEEEMQRAKGGEGLALAGRTSTTVQRGSGKVDLNLGHLALFCFDAYVPRKLARLVELFYQVEAVASARGNGRTLEKRLGESIDVRVVLLIRQREV